MDCIQMEMLGDNAEHTSELSQSMKGNLRHLLTDSCFSLDDLAQRY
jgi:hypothetical protein